MIFMQEGINDWSIEKNENDGGGAVGIFKEQTFHEHFRIPVHRHSVEDHPLDRSPLNHC